MLTPIERFHDSLDTVGIPNNSMGKIKELKESLAFVEWAVRV